MITEVGGRDQEISIPLRQSTSIVYPAVLFAFVGILCLTLWFIAFPAALSSLLWTAAFLFLAPVLACIFYRCHACLILNEMGLRWRTWGDWRQTLPSPTFRGRQGRCHYGPYCVTCLTTPATTEARFHRD